MHIGTGYNCPAEHREDESGLQLLPTAVQAPEGHVCKGQAGLGTPPLPGVLALHPLLPASLIGRLGPRVSKKSPPA